MDRYTCRFDARSGQHEKADERQHGQKKQTKGTPVPIEMTHVIRRALNLSNVLLMEHLQSLDTLALVPYMECQHDCAFTLAFANASVPI